MKTKIKILIIKLFLLASISAPLWIHAQDSIAPTHDTTVAAIDTPMSPVKIPDFFHWELPSSTGGTTGTMIFILVGLIVYLVREWRKKVIRDGGATFDIAIWIGQNWIKLVMYVIGIVVLYYQSGAMHPLAAFMLGFTPAALIDWVKKEFDPKA